MTDYANEIISFLNESLLGNIFYIFSAKPNDFVYHALDVSRSSARSTEYVLTWKDSDYKSYVKDVSYFAPDNEYNFIYRINKKLNLFQHNVSKVKMTEEQFDTFRETFDGFIGLEVCIFRDVVEKNLELIDGNALRFPGELDKVEVVDDIYWEDTIMPSLKHYQEKAGRDLPINVIEWLKENIKKPYSSKVLYRGFGVDFGPSWYEREQVPPGLTLEECNSKLKDLVGLNSIEEIKVHTKILHKRGKQSGWSLYPDVAEGFGRGWGEGHLNFLIQSDIPSDMIILDTSTLPDKFRKDLQYWSQNEVIVEDVPIKSRLLKVWANDTFKEWLVKKNLRILPKVGVIPYIRDPYSKPPLI
jgi:hypothetical protein